MNDAVEHYRAAPDLDKSAAADALAEVKCTDPEVCEAKKACLAVAVPQVKSIALKGEVQAGLLEVRAGTLKADSPAAQALPGKLEDAARLLAEAASQLEPCQTRLETLKRKHGLPR